MPEQEIGPHIVMVGSGELRSLISMDDAIRAVRNAFLALGRGEFEMPARTVSVTAGSS